MELRLDLSMSLWENLGEYHEKLKKLKKKKERLEQLLKEEKREERKEERKIVVVKKRKRDWYEKFRWMFTRNGFLCIGGRDARTNEQIVRKYLDEMDVFFHADVHGAPSVVLKNGAGAEAEDIADAALFAAVYSSAWKAGLPYADVFYVPAEQVSLAPPSGEYRPKGGVMVYGKREWVRKIPLEIHLSFDADAGRFYVSPVEVRPSVLLRPGGDRSETAKKILHLFGLGKEHVNDLFSVLPPGGVEIVRKIGF